jgi:hypothetical protein
VTAALAVEEGPESSDYYYSLVSPGQELPGFGYNFLAGRLGEQNHFGLLVSQVDGLPFATHLPFLLHI